MVRWRQRETQRGRRDSGCTRLQAHMIIDFSAKEYTDADKDALPRTLEGEVLLGYTRNDKDEITGCLSCSIEDVEKFKTYSETQRSEHGLSRYSSIIDAATPDLINKAKQKRNAIIQARNGNAKK